MSNPPPTRPRGTSLHLTSHLLPLTVSILAILQLTSPHRAWMTLLIGLGGAWLIAALWARSLKGGFRLEREIRSPWSQVGDEMLERLTLTNEGWAPAPSVEVVDHSSLPGRRRSRVVSVGGHGMNRWLQSAVCVQRGVYEIGPTALRTTDPLGLYEVEIHLPASSTVTVLPPTVHLPALEIAAAGRLTDGRPKRTGLEGSVSSDSVRPYLPGDDLRWVHWPTSAHHGELHIKNFDPVSSGDWWIFLDLDRAAQAGEGQLSTEEHGVILAASLAARGLERGRSVGLVTQHGADSVAWLAPAPGARQRWKLLRQLATARQGQHTLSDLLRAAESQLRRPASLLLITPTPPSSWFRDLQPLLARNAQATAFILDRSNYDRSLSSVPLDRWKPHPEITFHIVESGRLQDNLPDAEPAVDWRRTRPENRAWQRVTQ